MLIRYFAGAAEAAGHDEEVVEVEPGTPVTALLQRLSSQKPQLAKVLAVSALLLDAERCSDRSQLLDGVETLDVLPPFAGG